MQRLQSSGMTTAARLRAAALAPAKDKARPATADGVLSATPDVEWSGRASVLDSVADSSRFLDDPDGVLLLLL